MARFSSGYSHGYSHGYLQAEIGSPCHPGLAGPAGVTLWARLIEYNRYRFRGHSSFHEAAVQGKADLAGV
eukprot:197043-Hanusia_phi.AAC.1